jgi:general secretion pathway protein D
LKMNNLGERVLNPKTVIIYSDTKDKEKQYQDQLIQIFYLSNIDAKKAVNLLRTMLQLRKIYVHEELNAIVIRDTPDVIRLAQQILEAADRADAEVLYDLELVEINHSDDMNIGPRLSTYGTSFGYVPPGTTSIPGTVTVEGLSNLQFLYTIPTATFQLEKTLKDSEILANPKIRVKNKEKAKVHIGSREPVITVTTTGTTGITSDSIQYVDVGVKLEVEPTVQLDNTVDTKISLEVSNVTGRNTTDNGTLALTLSTTNASTDLTLKDGETTILGGLIRDDYTKTKDTFPILGKIPLLGDLISGHLRNKSKREILLSITPHIVKSVDVPKANVASIWSGGEDDLKAGPNFSAFAAPLQAEQSRLAPPPVPGRSNQPTEMFTPAQAEPAGPAPEAMPESAAPPTIAPQGLPENGPSPAAAPASTGAPAMPGMAEAPPSEAGVATVAMPRREALAAPGQARVFLRGPTLVKAGEEFVVEVDVDSLHDLYSAPFFLNFPPQLCTFTRVEEGGFLGSGGQPTIFTSSANQKNGQLIIGTKQGNAGTGASGSGTLARVVFTAKAAGSGDLSLDRINFRDPSGSRLPVAAEGLRIEVR